MDQEQQLAKSILLQCYNNGQIVHFIGIGGIGMSGIAEILRRKNYRVTGSDIQNNSNIHRLINLGIPINIKHDESNITFAVGCVVFSTCIDQANPEIQIAKLKNVPILHRGQVLAYLMETPRIGTIGVSGAHGKTSTTGLIGNLLWKAGMDPLIINGGIMTEFGSNIRHPEETKIPPKWIVAEADESDGTFNILPCSIVVITNIDMDHDVYFKNEQNLLVEYDKFIRKCLAQGGICIICSDCPRAQKLLQNFGNAENIYTYGLGKSSLVQAGNIETTDSGTVFDVKISNSFPVFKLKLPQYGEYSVQNALATITLAKILNIPNDILRSTLENNSGVQRRFTLVGNVNGISVYDDYAHHPAEIKAVLDGGRKSMENSTTQGKLIIVHQPHRYSRLALHFTEFLDCFNCADTVLLLPVYSAGESNTEYKVSSNTLYRKLLDKFSRSNIKAVELFTNFDEIKEYVKKVAKSGDLILFTGAGNITQLAQDMPSYL